MSLSSEWIKRELDERDTAFVHRPMEDEYAFYTAVKNGNMEYVQDNCKNGSFANPEGMGKLSNNPLTNIKYHFVITVALVTRHCVEGGLALEQSYRLSDFYISKLDFCNAVTDVTKLHSKMVLDFTRKMLLLQKEPIISKAILQCTDYIYNHLHERITVNSLAEYTKLSPSYLSRLFKKNLSTSVSDYILEKKIELAENMLKYSNSSYIEIANYLTFSSQSHFIQTFRKKIGLTPKQYRNKYYHTTW